MIDDAYELKCLLSMVNDNDNDNDKMRLQRSWISLLKLSLTFVMLGKIFACSTEDVDRSDDSTR